MKASRTLVHTKSDGNGSFKVDLPDGPESLLVFGYAESVDGPPGYAYTRLRPNAPTTAVILDFTHGHCGR